ncbi:protein FAM83A isoform X2 [Pipistrellus kuhlii]|uniref:protein FAM83A isoform X2 n=1 Tax=Pipistrellus kuhlii TaxID=59472 RepID=UPI001E26F5D3|nr:protein FAM83A isoform X2 [Pipistrellus kuhlii]
MSRARQVGKLRRRLEDVKSQWVRPAKADLSDHESARLATDALLDGGPEAYRQVLHQEGEVDFLSSAETQYIQAQAREPPRTPDTPGGAEAGPRGPDACSLQSGTYYPAASEDSEPALLHAWASAEKPCLQEPAGATVYFQTDKHNIRDLVRRCITRSRQVLAILMDVFTDVEIFCDLLEAAKRGVLVCVLLDQGGVRLFREMCDRAQVCERHLQLHLAQRTRAPQHPLQVHGPGRGAVRPGVPPPLRRLPARDGPEVPQAGRPPPARSKAQPPARPPQPQQQQRLRQRQRPPVLQPKPVRVLGAQHPAGPEPASAPQVPAPPRPLGGAGPEAPGWPAGSLLQARRLPAPQAAAGAAGPAAPGPRLEAVPAGHPSFLRGPPPGCPPRTPGDGRTGRQL